MGGKAHLKEIWNGFPGLYRLQLFSDGTSNPLSSREGPLAVAVPEERKGGVLWATK